jgi:hypothetical protein
MTAIAAGRNPQPVTGWWTPRPEHTHEHAQVQLTAIAQAESRRLTALRTASGDAATVPSPPKDALVNAINERNPR